MSDWTGGYIADIGYTHGYYSELNPQRIKLAFLKAGIALTDAATACELGFGQGLSANLHAAASVISWHGTDLNPAQAGYAQQLAAASGAKVALYDEAFAEFCGRSDLPQFDFIGLHGIWSWISDENRHLITDFLRRKLKVGGVLYISYNTQPGWAAMAPLRDLLAEHAELMGAAGVGILPRVDGAVAFAEKLLASGAGYGVANPQVAGKLAALKGQNRSYLAHEYFNRDWLPMSFSRMHDWLDQAKLTFACSANYIDHVDVLNLTPEQQQLLVDIPDPSFRETTRDFLVNQQFRRDYWVRGLRVLPPPEQIEMLRRQRFVMTMPRQDITMSVIGALGEATLHNNVYQPILDLMGDYRIHTLHDVENALAGLSDFGGVLRALMILMGKASIQMAQDDPSIDQAALQCRRLNRELCRQARYSPAVSALASPVTGGGVTVGRFDQIFLLAAVDAPDQPAAWARYLLQILAAQGQHIAIDGKLPTSRDIEMNEALRLATEFQAKHLPMLSALGIHCHEN
jgi:SAM-dependent methyltransferase